jgi:hypothetical protein
MTVGAQIAQTEPPPVITTGMRTKVQRGVDLTGAPVRRGHGVWWYRRRCLGRRGISLTQGTMRLVRQALEGFRRVEAVGLGFEGLGLLRWRGWSRHRALGPGDVQDDDEPEECE